MLLLLLHLAATPALADFCVTADDIDERTQSCEDNFLFVQQADACVERLNGEVRQATAKLQQKFVKNDGKNQSLDFNSSLLDYNFSSVELARLIVINKQAIADVSSYFDFVVHPEDVDNPEATEGMSPQDWADSVACYGRTRNSLRHVVKVLNDKLANLERTKSIADAHDATSDRREQANSVLVKKNQVIKNGVGKGQGKLAGKQRQPASDITGTEEERRKGAKGDALLKGK